MIYDVIIIGGGPSGLMASINASKKYKNVLLIEKNKGLGKKLLASGNGRCNVTNVKTNNDFIKNVQSSNSKFLLSSLSEFGPWDIYDFFCDNNCLLKEEDDNRVFPISDNSKDILDVLVNHLSNVEIKLEESVIDVTKKEDFIVNTDKGCYKAKKVVLSTGGKSYPTLGTTGDGYEILKRFELNIVNPLPALTSLNSNESFIKDNILLGITLPNCRVSYNNKSVEGNVLFTHFGVSGPGIFKISEDVVRSLLNSKEEFIYIDMLEDSLEEILDQASNNPNNTIGSLFKGQINKVIKYLLKEYENKKISSISNKLLIELINKFKQFKISIYDSKGFKTAFVTSGGLSLEEVNPKTMEVKKVEGLFVTGELLDLHAYTGGYNITIALSTGYKAGNSV
ncbi:MAG: NAD(P)/FAD-dependent oxidoreductase [bacterium]